MNDNTVQNTPGKRRLLYSLCISLAALAVAYGAAEILLRCVHIPGIGFNTSQYDAVTGLKYSPHSTHTYRSTKGEYTKRRINSWGYADKEFSKAKGPGVYRIGFFGDSYTYAIQVPLGHTFYRVIEDSLKNDNVETLAFGVSGFGTLHSYLNSTRYADMFDLDMIVYVFYGNDPGDHIREITGAKNAPRPILTDDGFEIDNSFRERNSYRNGTLYRIVNYVSAHSIVFATVSERLKLLTMPAATKRLMKDEGSVARPDGADRLHRFNTLLHSSWPDSLRKCAEELEKAIVLQWKREAERSSRAFVIITVPVSNCTDGPDSSIRPDETWESWLGNYCRDQKINFIDPLPHMIEARRTGAELYHDHLTRSGHLAFARAFIEWFRDYRARMR